MYPPGDVQAAAKAIERIAKDAALRQTLKSGGKKTVESRDWENLRQEIRALYDCE